jgi:hypothetical protein
MQKIYRRVNEASLYVGYNVLDFLNDHFRVSVVLDLHRHKGKGKVNVKLFLCTPLRHMEDWSIAPDILNLGTKWASVVPFIAPVPT